MVLMWPKKQLHAWVRWFSFILAIMSLTVTLNKSLLLWGHWLLSLLTIDVAVPGIQIRRASLMLWVDMQMKPKLDHHIQHLSGGNMDPSKEVGWYDITLIAHDLRSITWCISPWVRLWDVCKATCHSSCSPGCFQESLSCWGGWLCNENSVPFHFLYQIGGCHVNALDISEREMKWEY